MNSLASSFATCPVIECLIGKNIDIVAVHTHREINKYTHGHTHTHTLGHTHTHTHTHDHTHTCRETQIWEREEKTQLEEKNVRFTS